LLGRHQDLKGEVRNVVFQLDAQPAKLSFPEGLDRALKLDDVVAGFLPAGLIDAEGLGEVQCLSPSLR